MKPKNEKRPTVQEITAEAQKSLGKPVGWRWQVEEYWPAHNSGDCDDIDYPDQVMSRSKYFYSVEEAEEFMESVAVDRPEYRLRIKAETCWERVERYWL